MTFRVTDSSQRSIFSDRVNAQRARVAHAQELISSGRKINRPSDNPFGTDAVLRLRTSVSSIEQFQEAGSKLRDNLQIADVSLNSYEVLLDRARTLLTTGASDTTTAANR